MDRHQQDAETAGAALRAAGYSVEVKHYQGHPGEHGYPRSYVLVAAGAFRYQAQWHERRPAGTGFMSARGDGWDEATAAHLTALVG